MSHASTTLSDIIESSFDGKKSNLATAAKLAPRVITRLTQDQAFTPGTLDQICHALAPDDAARLCASVCRDILPAEYSTEIHLSSELDQTLHEDPVPYRAPSPPLDATSEQILLSIRRLCAKEPETRAWLKRIGSWISNEKKS